jgi:hypothetical protein
MDREIITDHTCMHAANSKQIRNPGQATESRQLAAFCACTLRMAN